MKKIIAIFSVCLLLIIGLLACSQNDDDMTALENAEALLIINDFNGLTAVEGDFLLPALLDNGTIAVNWHSSNETYLVIEAWGEELRNAAVRQPAIGSEAVQLTLTATLSRGSATLETTFNVRILPELPPLSIATIKSPDVRIDTVVNIRGAIVIGLLTDGFYLADETDYIFVFTSAAPQVRVGDAINLRGNKVLHDFMPQIANNALITVISSENSSPLTGFAPTTPGQIQGFERLAWQSYRHFEVTGRVRVEGANIFLEDAYNANNFIAMHARSLAYRSDLTIFDGFVVTIKVVVHNWFQGVWQVSAVEGPDADLTDAERIAFLSDWLALAVPPQYIFRDGPINLPANGGNLGGEISWTSDNQSIINTTTNTVILPDSPTEVRLTAIIRVGNLTEIYVVILYVGEMPLSTPEQIQALGAGNTSLVRVRGTVIFRNEFSTPDVFLQTEDGRGHFIWRLETHLNYFALGNEVEVFINARGPLNGGLKQLDGARILNVTLISSGQPLPEFVDITNQLRTYSDAELAAFQMSMVEARGLRVTSIPRPIPTNAFSINVQIGTRDLTLRVDNVAERAALNAFLAMLSVGDIINVKAPAGWFNGLQLMLTSPDLIEITELSEEDRLEAALAAFTIPNISSDSVVLPTTGAHGSTIEFLSASPAGIIDLTTGEVIRGASAVTVTLSFIMRVGSAYRTATIDVVVGPEDRPLNVMISQIYAGGGNVNAPYNQKFVELFNPFNEAVDISGWSLRYVAPAAANFPNPGQGNFLTFPAGTTIPARSFFLIGIHQGATGANLPVAVDFEDTRAQRVNPGANAGILILMNDTAPFTNAYAANVVDLVGWFANANTPVNLFAGQPIQRAGSNVSSFIRNNLINTFNNHNDFGILARPNPRNSTMTA
ncbi:MAG: lamin tail domain-containing protein [Erysipelotrichales bacterium]|nr:lamin tail domain-containing protein [Erysipelotrichales bacterium]